MRSKKHCGKRFQEVCIEFIESEIVRDEIREESRSLETILQFATARYQVSSSQLRRWYNHYIEWGEYPCETRAKKQKFNQLSKQWKRTKVVSESIVSTLRDIVEESPEFYIDEIAEELSK